jgi:hypothetical protein
MNKARVIIAAIFCLAITGSLLLPASQADTTKTSSKQVTFTKDVAPIFFKNCAECHRAGEAAPFSVMSYKDVRPWAKSIREKVVNRDRKRGERMWLLRECYSFCSYAGGGVSSSRLCHVPTSLAIFVNRAQTPNGDYH